jgi:hypothetical protein
VAGSRFVATRRLRPSQQRLGQHQEEALLAPAGQLLRVLASLLERNVVVAAARRWQELLASLCARWLPKQ